MNENKKHSIPKRKIKCPQCGRLTYFSSENPFRPFCSERCRLLDLGQWADESYRIPIEQSSVSSELEIPEEDADNYQ
jgi:endogenous inhibitor of DNA gyrase (YacG/DUF329 family)